MTVSATPQPQKRGRGRPSTKTPKSGPPAKKRKVETPSPATYSKNSSYNDGETPVQKKTPGRPKGSVNKKKNILGDDKSPIKTRRILKSNKTNPHCTLCKKMRKEALKSCFQCGLSYHLSHCLSMIDPHLSIALNQDEWNCPKCLRCSTCHGIINDVGNLECGHCLRAWHAHCFKGKTDAKEFICRRCKNHPEEAGPSNAASASTTTPLRVKDHWRKGRPKLLAKRRLPKGWVTVPEGIMHGGDIQGNGGENPEEEAIEEILDSRSKVWDTFVEEFRAISARQPPKKDRSKSRSPEKRAPLPPVATLPAQRITTVEDYDLFESALRELRQTEALHDTPGRSRNGNNSAIGKWVYLGEAAKMKALYASPYSEAVLKGDSIFVCPFCLNATSQVDTYRIHLENCEFRHPPGHEIYREGQFSFYEVDGGAQRLYCRNLCLLAKMFISSKTLHHEVETFLFYILTENTPQGCRIVAYFSKEKNPSKNNNLSCLLTLPGENRKGFGKLLIDMSYELSRLEHKIGSPEHPLSDLGLFAYRGYWRAAILQHLRSLHNAPSTSIKSMALATRINPSDIINQLLRDKLLAYIDGNYFIKTGKRAFKWPLSFFRRRAIDRSKLIWQPDYDISDLDPNKINYYV